MISDEEKGRYEQSYRDTEYRVNLGAGLAVTIRIGEVAELDALLQRHYLTQWAFLTAWNPSSKLHTKAENVEANIRLRTDLSAGTDSWAIFDGEGVGRDGNWPAELSFLILGIAKEEAMKLACQYGQLAFVYGTLGQPAELVWSEP